VRGVTRKHRGDKKRVSSCSWRKLFQVKVRAHKILIVDDDKGTCDLLRARLEEKKHSANAGCRRLGICRRPGPAHRPSACETPPGSGKSHLAQDLGQAAIQQGYRVLYRETHTLLDELTEVSIDGTRKQHIESLVSVPLLIIDDLGMRKLSLTAAEELLEIIMRRYERASTVITSNRPVNDWGKLLGDSAAVTAMLDRLLHHGHVLKCGPRSWRTKTGLPPQQAAG
jgi:hypothetical protein